MPNVNPRKIDGPWADGRVLDLHSTGSEFLGHDEFGREQFDTHRTEVGELLYRLKYRNDASALEEIGYYDVTKNPAQVNIDTARAEHWISRGAQVSPTVKRLLNQVSKVAKSA